jgi:hypothetical protein
MFVFAVELTRPEHHRIKKPLHAKNLPFAFDELYEIRAFRSYRPRPGPNTIHQ